VDPPRSTLRAPIVPVAAGLLVVYIVWGSTYLGIKVADESLPPLIMLSGRFLIAAVLLGAWCLARGELRDGWPDLAAWRDAAIVAACLMLGGLGLVALGEQSVPTGIAALLIATVPLWMALFERAFLGVRLTMPVLVGLVVGFSGVVLLVWPGGGNHFNAGGLALILLSPLFWTSGTLYARSARLPRRPLVATTIEMLCGGVILAVVGLARGEGSQLHLQTLSGRSVAAFAYLIVVGSLIAFTAYVWLLGVAPLSLVSTYAYVNPVVALALGATLEGESITARTVLASAVIVAGVALIISAHAFRRGEPRQREAPA
jgi:drug/metabolite transporter (DMT)-like permease